MSELELFLIICIAMLLGLALANMTKDERKDLLTVARVMAFVGLFCTILVTLLTLGFS